MFTKEPGSDIPFDGVSVVEGSFKVTPAGKPFVVDLLVAYVDSNTKTTFGTCSAKLPMMSPNTLDALRKFLDSAEEDFGRVIFQHGGIRAQAPGKSGLGWRTVNAEKNEPLVLDDKSMKKKGW